MVRHFFTCCDLSSVPINPFIVAAYVANLEAGRIRGDQKGPLFRSAHRHNHRRLSQRLLHQVDVHAMIKRRTKATGLPETAGWHTFQVTGITPKLNKDGTLENASAILAHESFQTTRLYDRTGDKIILDEAGGIAISRPSKSSVFLFDPT